MGKPYRQYTERSFDKKKIFRLNPWTYFWWIVWRDCRKGRIIFWQNMILLPGVLSCWEIVSGACSRMFLKESGKIFLLFFCVQEDYVSPLDVMLKKRRDQPEGYYPFTG